MLNCVEYLYSLHKIWKSWSHNLAKTWLVFAYIKCQKCNCFAWDINKFLGTLSHLLTVTNFLACRKQTLFSAGETTAEKSVCPSQATAFRACASNRFVERWFNLMVTFEKEIPVTHFRFTHLSLRHFNTCLRERKLLSLYMFHRIIFLLLIVSSLSCNFIRCADCFQSFSEHRLQEYSKCRALNH